MKEKLTFITLFSMLFGVIFPMAQPVYSNRLTKIVAESNSVVASGKICFVGRSQ